MSKTNSPKSGFRKLKPEMIALDAFRRLLRDGATTCQAARDDIMASDDPDAVHRARVALRRMRSILRGMGDMLRPRAHKALQKLLADEFRRYGPLRDADVHAAVLPDGPRRNAALAHAAELRAALRSELSRSAELSLKIRIDTLTHDQHRLIGGGSRSRLALAPVGIVASRALQVAWTTMLAFGNDPLDLPPDERHEFRKRAKDMRYLTDAFAPVFPDAEAKSLLTRIAKLQEALGHLNDLTMIASVTDGDLPADTKSYAEKARKAARKAWAGLRKERVWWGNPQL